MTNANVVVEDELVIKLILDFLYTRKLHKSLRGLEKETGVVNCGYSDDVLFLRQLILDGEWESVLIFGQPLESIEGFDLKTFRYLVLKQKFMEVLFYKSGIGSGTTSYSIEDLIKCLNQLEKDCPNKDEYGKLCWLLTVPNLPEQPEYRDWNPETARIRCFEEVLDVLRRVIPVERRGSDDRNGKLHVPPSSSKDRLVNLLVKGFCFEGCVEYCQQRAINGDDLGGSGITINSGLLSEMPQETTGNFLSWLKSLSQDAFTTPFEPLAIEVEFRKAKRMKTVKNDNLTVVNDNEILSRSLSLSGRPATADVVSHLSRSETEGQTCPIRANTVSNSYSAFHFRGMPELKKQSQGYLNNGSKEIAQSKTGSKVLEVETTANLLKEQASRVNQPRVYQPQNTDLNKQDVRNSLLSLKQEQQQNVLSQLEEHKKQQKELQKQLMELSTKLNSDVKEFEQAAKSDLEKVDLSALEKSQNILNLHYSNDTKLEKSGTVQKTYIINNMKELPTSPQHSSHTCGTNIDHSHADVLTESDLRQMDEPYHGTPQRKRLDHNSATFIQAVTSTPAPDGKVKVKPLALEESNLSMLPGNTDVGVPPVTPDAGKFPPMTPKENGVPFGAGHWIALADGSGVLNTSTPKSSRQKMSETPVPPASPVLSVDGQTPVTGYGTPRQHMSLSQGIMREKLTSERVQNGDGPEGEMDKETPALLMQQPPVRKGPKINGVRRTLLPREELKENSIPKEEKKETKPIREEKAKHAQTVSHSSVQSKPQIPSNKSSNSVLRGTPRSHNGPVTKSKLAQGQEAQPQSKNSPMVTPSGTKVVVNREQAKPELAQSSAINVTYHKQVTAPPSNTTMSVGDNGRLLEHQREQLRSSSHPRFYTVATLEDVQAIRAVAFQPLGEMFAVGSNSKTLRICTSAGLNINGNRKAAQSQANQLAPQPTILYKRNKHHRGSIYCIAWSAQGDLIATGSNDKSIKMIHFDADNCTQIGTETELNIHAGTVRDVSFVSRPAGLPVLVSGGAADGSILISDCSTGQTVGALKGHAGAIMAVYAAGDDIIASGSADHTVRLWDLRSQRCIDAMATGDSCVASVCVNQQGTLLASGHEDGSCMIYDITAGRTLQLFKPHTMDCRTVRFSPDSHFLLSGSYDTSIILMDVKQNLEGNIPPYYMVAEHRDKVIQCRWHPHQLAFLSSSADRTASLWALDC